MAQHRFDPSIATGIRSLVRALLGSDEFGVLPRDLTVSPLSGGFNNTNLLLSGEGGKWVLKIRPDNYADFGADADSSISVQSFAARQGLAGRVVAVDSTGLHFATEFIEGVTVRPDYARNADLIPEVVDTIKRLNGGKCPCRRRSFFDDIRLFMKGVYALDIALPSGFRNLLSEVYDIEQEFLASEAPVGLCHNDLVPQNFIAAPDGLKLVDFDYAGSGQIAAELAGAASQFEMTEAETERFLALYDSDLDDAQRARVTAMRFCNNIREVSFTFFAEPLLADQTHAAEGFSIADHRAFNIGQAEARLRDHAFAGQRNAIRSVRAGAAF